MKNIAFRKSFTILELVIVITVTGVIMGSSFQLLMNIYKSYSYMYDMNALDLELTNASMKIVKYLENRVIGSVIESNETNFTVISGNYVGENNRTLQWIGKGIDTYHGCWDSSKSRVIPNWSGFLDLRDAHNNASIFLDNTDISQAENIIFILSEGEVNITDSNSKYLPAIFFKGGAGNDIDGFGWKGSIFDNNDTNKSNYYSEYSYIGYFEQNGLDLLFQADNQTIGFGEYVEDLNIYEQYALSWTAYGLKVEDDRNLSLYYNYRPWHKENMEENGTKITLLQNITEFKYSSNGANIKIEICIQDNNLNEIEFCRESLIY